MKVIISVIALIGISFLAGCGKTTTPASSVAADLPADCHLHFASQNLCATVSSIAVNHKTVATLRFWDKDAGSKSPGRNPAGAVSGLFVMTCCGTPKDLDVANAGPGVFTMTSREALIPGTWALFVILKEGTKSEQAKYPIAVGN